MPATHLLTLPDGRQISVDCDYQRGTRDSSTGTAREVPEINPVGLPDGYQSSIDWDYQIDARDPLTEITGGYRRFIY
jgi:hypothetical protein